MLNVVGDKEVEVFTEEQIEKGELILHENSEKWKMLSHVWLFICIVHGILQTRILQWVAFRSPKESSQPRDRTQDSSIAGRFFTSWATR